MYQMGTLSVNIKLHSVIKFLACLYPYLNNCLCVALEAGITLLDYSSEVCKFH